MLVDLKPQQIHSEVDAFLAWYLTTRSLPARVLEIGTAEGGTAVMWCNFAATQPNPQVLSIDLPNGTWGGRDVGYCWARNVGLHKRFPFFEGILADSHSGEALLWVDLMLGVKNNLDLLFIDGDHSYDGVKSDFQNYRKFTKPGGVVLLHDIKNTPRHHAGGVAVSQLWYDLQVDPEYQGRLFEFCDNSADWGGLGAIVMP